jgi:hypothetical protein
MKRARLGLSLIPRSVRAPLISLISLIAVAFVALGLAASAGASPAHPARPAAGPAAVRTVVLDCPGLPALVRPKTYILTCADGYDQLTELSWTSWTPGLASATGTLLQNDCTPTCVAGHFHRYPVLVVFWGKAAVQHHPGERCYTRMTLIYPGARPPHVPQTQTVSLPTSLPAL